MAEIDDQPRSPFEMTLEDLISGDKEALTRRVATILENLTDAEIDAMHSETVIKAYETHVAGNYAYQIEKGSNAEARKNIYQGLLYAEKLPDQDYPRYQMMKDDLQDAKDRRVMGENLWRLVSLGSGLMGLKQ